MDILLRRKFFRDQILKQKYLSKGLFHVRGLDFHAQEMPSETRLKYRYDFMSACLLNHKMKKAGLDKTFKELDKEFVKTLKFLRERMKEENQINRDYQESNIVTKIIFNKYHRLFLRKVVNAGILKKAFAVHASTSSSGLKMMEVIQNHINVNRYYTWEQVQKLREQTPSKLREQMYQDALEAFDEEESLVPKSNDKSNYLGIEIECVSKLNYRDMKKHLASKAPSLAKYVRLAGDGSIRAMENYPNCIEFRILVSEEKKNQVITRFLEVTKGLIKVNSSCGLHVHLDMRHRVYGNCFEQLYVAMPTLMSMVPSSRRSNQYCRENDDKKAWNKSNGGNRYQVLNTQSYRKYRTLEVRLHSATLSPTKMINWIDLLTLIIDKKFDKNETLEVKTSKKNLKPERQIRSLTKFFQKFDIPSELRNYIIRRITKFGKSEKLMAADIPAIPVNPTTVTTEQDELDDASSF